MRFAATLAILLTCAPAAAQHAAPARPAPVLPGLGSLHHPVSTRNPEAQRFFDQGLNLAYAFNHDEAFRAFGRAAELDPGLAMARWGQALVLGPNINLPIDEERSRRAHALVEQARALARAAPAVERDYIEALAQRYAAAPPADRAPLDRAYADAMRELTRRYPDDLDAATLFAEALMDLRPWQYWGKDGQPAEGTPEIVATLQGVLRRNPRHIGANHLLIHAVEASPTPELALGAARMLESEAPAAGHLVHMPTHIYAQLGDHAASARLNETAAETDRTYIERHGVTGVYPMMYYNHNLHFAAYSNAQRGDSRGAARFARRVWDSAAPLAAEMQMVELFTLTPLLVQARFRQWDEVLRQAEPPAHMPVTRGVWRFARGMARASRDAAAAGVERAALRAAIDSLPATAVVGFSPGSLVLRIAAAMLDGRIAEARGDGAAAARALELAAALEDSLAYDEPPDWYLHPRESLGGVHLRARQPVEAERAFRAELTRRPRNPRALFGLAEALRSQKRDGEAALVEREFRAAWQGADVQLTLADL